MYSQGETFYIKEYKVSQIIIKYHKKYNVKLKKF